MVYVIPDGEVRILRNVPIDISYTTTLYFRNQTQQETYFKSKTKYTFEKLSYVRNTPGVIKLQIDADRINECNYLMYKNTAYAGRWFYAFIINVAYISNTACSVTFVIDPLQTWLFDMQLGQCFIDRQHSETDVAGDNLIPEGLETGEYIYADNGVNYHFQWASYDLLAFCSFTADLLPNNTWTNFQPVVTGRYAYGTYTGLHLRVFQHIEQQSTVDLFNSFVDGATNAGVNTGNDGILAVIMIPHGITAISEPLETVEVAHSVAKISGTIDGYTPKNNKLFTAPYVFIEAQNCEGATAVFPQEYFSGANATFTIGYGMSSAPCAVCIPTYYKGLARNISEALYINNFPQCAFNTDMYKAFLAQSLTAQLGLYAVDKIQGVGEKVINFVSDVAEGGKSVANDVGYVVRNMISNFRGQGNVDYTPYTPSPTTPGRASFLNDLPSIKYRGETDMGLGNALGAIGAIGAVAGSDVAGQVYSALAQLYAKSVAPGHNTGSNTSDYLTSKREKGFLFFRRTIRAEYARIIDQYFSRFGYAQHKIDTPNLRARDRWTYVKTIDCNVHGNIPAEAASQIENVFNNGITWWADTDNVGNYSLDNGIYHEG